MACPIDASVNARFGDEPMTHFAHYLPRYVVEVNYRDASDPWFSQNQPDDQGFAAPTYHVTRSISGPAARVSQGDIIWLFSQLLSPWGKSPPALDAKIVVRGVMNASDAENCLSRGFRFEAANASKWFPLYDSTTCIRRLRTRDFSGHVRPLLSYPDQPIGQALQSMRELAQADPLLEWEQQVSEMSVDFISYRILDGTRLAFEKMIELVHAGRAVFWDRWSLPRRLAERREFLNNDALDGYIMHQMNECSTVWAICSGKYAEPDSYSEREMREAQRLGKLQISGFRSTVA